MPKLVYDFTEGNKDLKDLLGGKGANLAEMTNLGLPVPPGFIITTEACRYYLEQGSTPAGLDEEIAGHLDQLESAMGRKLGDPADPLLVSVRSGAKFSMPGMMDTVLNIGLSDESVQGLAKQAGNERFAWDSYRRLLQMFGKTVLDIDGEHFEHAIEAAKQAKGVSNDLDLDAADLQNLVETFKGIIKTQAGRDFPQEPREQMDLAIKAVFNSWNPTRAILYRRQERIPTDLGTAVNVVAMVFGNLGMDSGTGVAFTRDPGTGAQGVYGDYLQNAQGEDVVAGIRNTVPLQDLERIDKASYDQLMQIMRTLENHYRDLCDIEFTIERGKLWMLQTRVGKRTAAAAFRIAMQLVDQDLIDMDEALTRVSGEELARLMFPRFDTSGEVTKIATGISASPGAAVGQAVFDSATRGRAGGQRREGDPGPPRDQPGRPARHDRRPGHPDQPRRQDQPRGRGRPRHGQDLRLRRRRTRRGHQGEEVHRPRRHHGQRRRRDLHRRHQRRRLPRRGPRRLVRGRPLLRGRPAPALRRGRRPDPRRALDHGARRPQAQARRVRQRGHRSGLRPGPPVRRRRRRPGPHRAHVPRRAPSAGRGPDPGRHPGGAAARAGCSGAAAARRLRGDPGRHGRAAGDDPADRPAAARVPARPDRPSVKVALAGEAATEKDKVLLAAVRRLHEQNPMLGLRGVRLGLVIPGLFEMQVRAIAHAAAELKQANKDPRPEVMIPLTATVQEMEIMRERTEKVLKEVEEETGAHVHTMIGTMIEVPRAAVNAGPIAASAEFFSFGTNDLTQMTWGFSRDDVEGAFFSRYIELGIFGVSPFETIDRDGVGRLVDIAVREGRAARPDIELGVCGEHGGDPDSVHFFHEVGLDYVSCSPFRVPIARLEAGRAALAAGGSDSR